MQSLWMVLAAFLFAIMGVCVKYAAQYYSIHEIVFYRGLIGVLIIAVIMRWQGASIKTSYPWQHAWRGFVGSSALWLWFVSIAHLPLATAMTLNYLAPVWIAFILFALKLINPSAKISGQNFKPGFLATIALGFLGVVLLLQPILDKGQIHYASFAITSSVLAAFAYLAIKNLGQLGEPEHRTVFYFSLTNILFGVCTAYFSNYGMQIFFDRNHTITGLATLLGTGISATFAQIAMTRAYQQGSTLLTANLHYSGIIFASFWGVLLWHEHLNLLSLAGIVLIILSGSIATWYTRRTYS